MGVTLIMFFMVYNVSVREIRKGDIEEPRDTTDWILAEAERVKFELAHRRTYGRPRARVRKRYPTTTTEYSNPAFNLDTHDSPSRYDATRF